MKKFIFLLVLCLVSINIYAQRDTVFSTESDVPIILSVPDSIYNPDATVEQNVIAWRTKKPVALYDGENVIEFNYFKVYRHKTQKILAFNPIARKNEISEKKITTRINYLFDIIFLYIVVCAVTLIFLLSKIIQKGLKEVYKNGVISERDCRNRIKTFKYFLPFPLVFLCIVSLKQFLGFHYYSYTLPGLFLPVLIFLAGVMTPIIVRKIYRDKKQEKEHPEVGGDMCG